MSIEYVMGLIVGILGGMALVAALIFLIRKCGGKVGMRKCKTGNYDERQMLARGKAYKYAFFTLMFYVLIAQTLYEVCNVALFSSFGGMWLGVCAATGVFVVSCVWMDAYISLSENKKGVLMLFTGIAVINLIVSIIGICRGEASIFETMKAVKDEELMELTTLSVGSVNLTCAILFIVICIAIVLKALSESKEDLED